MAENAPEEVEVDAELDDLPRRSWFGQFLKGAVSGAVLSAIGIVALLLLSPLPEERQVDRGARVSGPAAEPAPASVAEAPAEAPASEAPAAETPADAVTGEPAAAEPEAQAPAAPVETAEAPAETPAPTEPVEPAGNDAVPVEAEVDTAAPAGAGEETVAASETVAAEPAAEPAAPERRVPKLTGPAVQVNARSIEVPATAQPLAIVFNNAGNGSLTAEKLLTLKESNLSVTLAIRPGDFARDLGLKARETGHEVLAQLPTGGAEGALVPGMDEAAVRAKTEDWLATLDMAVGAAGIPGTETEGDQEVMYALLATLDDYGFAWIDDRDPALSVARKLADGLDLPYVAAMSGEPEAGSVTAIAGMLDRAASAARATGSGVVILPSSDASFQAVSAWALDAERRGKVVPVPVSVVLARRGQGL